MASLMGWIKYENEPVWWDPDERTMVVVYGPPNPRDTPAVWSASLTPTETPYNEVQDDLFVVLRIDWTERDGEPAEVIETRISEAGVRETLTEFGIDI